MTTSHEIIVIKGTQKVYTGHLNSFDGMRDIVHFFKTNDHTGLQVICFIDSYAGAIVTPQDILEVIERVVTKLEQVDRIARLIHMLNTSYLN